MMSEACDNPQFSLRPHVVQPKPEAGVPGGRHERWVSLNKEILQNILENTIKRQMTQTDSADEDDNVKRRRREDSVDTDGSDVIVNVDGSTSVASDTDSESINVTRCDDESIRDCSSPDRDFPSRESTPSLPMSLVAPPSSQTAVTPSIRQVDDVRGDPGYVSYRDWLPGGGPGRAVWCGPGGRLGSLGTGASSTSPQSAATHNHQHPSSDNMTVDHQRSKHEHTTNKSNTMTCTNTDQYKLDEDKGNKKRVRQCKGRQHWVRISKAAIEDILDELVVASISDDSGTESRSHTPTSEVSDTSSNTRDVTEASDVTGTRAVSEKNGRKSPCETVRDRHGSGAMADGKTESSKPGKLGDVHPRPPDSRPRNNLSDDAVTSAISMGWAVLNKPLLSSVMDRALAEHASNTSENTDTNKDNNKDKAEGLSDKQNTNNNSSDNALIQAMSKGSGGPWNNPATALLLGALCMGEHNKVRQLAASRNNKRPAEFPVGPRAKLPRAECVGVDLRTSRRDPPDLIDITSEPNLELPYARIRKPYGLPGSQVEETPCEVIDVDSIGMSPPHAAYHPSSISHGQDLCPINLVTHKAQHTLNDQENSNKLTSESNIVVIDDDKSYSPSKPYRAEKTVPKTVRRGSKVVNKCRREPRYGWIVVSKDEVHTIMDSLTSQLLSDDAIHDSENNAKTATDSKKSSSTQSEVLRDKENHLNQTNVDITKATSGSVRTVIDGEELRFPRDLRNGELHAPEDDFRRSTIDALSAVYKHEDRLGVDRVDRDRTQPDQSFSDNARSPGDKSSPEREVEAAGPGSSSPQPDRDASHTETAASPPHDNAGEEQSSKVFKWKSSILARVLDDQDTDDGYTRSSDTSDQTKSDDKRADTSSGRRVKRVNKRR